MTTLSKDTLQQLAQDIRDKAGGTIFSVCFVKRGTGETRHMHCRFGVKKYLKAEGKGQVYRPEDYNLLTVWDVAKQDYRCIPLDTILSFRVRGKTYKRKENH